MPERGEMVVSTIDRIGEIYAGSVGPVNPTGKPGKGEVVRHEPETHAAKLIPKLKDRVEISEEGRKAAEAQGLAAGEQVPEETRETIEGSWYAAGYGFALETVDRAT